MCSNLELVVAEATVVVPVVRGSRKRRREVPGVGGHAGPPLAAAHAPGGSRPRRPR